MERKAVDDFQKESEAPYEPSEAIQRLRERAAVVSGLAKVRPEKEIGGNDGGQQRRQGP